MIVVVWVFGLLVRYCYNAWVWGVGGGWREECGVVKKMEIKNDYFSCGSSLVPSNCCIYDRCFQFEVCETSSFRVDNLRWPEAVIMWRRLHPYGSHQTTAGKKPRKDGKLLYDMLGREMSVEMFSLN